MSDGGEYEPPYAETLLDGGPWSDGGEYKSLDAGTWTADGGTWASDGGLTGVDACRLSEGDFVPFASFSELKTRFSGRWRFCDGKYPVAEGDGLELDSASGRWYRLVFNANSQLVRASGYHAGGTIKYVESNFPQVSLLFNEGGGLRRLVQLHFPAPQYARRYGSGAPPSIRAGELLSSCSFQLSAAAPLW